MAAKKKQEQEQEEQPAVGFDDVFGDDAADLETDGDRGDSVETEDNAEAPKAEAEPEQPAESEAEPEKPAEGEGDKPQGEQKIPKSRFDEVNERRKEAERKLKEQQEKAKQEQGETAEPSVDFDFDAAEEAYQDAVLDGDKETAKAKRAEIRAAEQKLYEQRAQQNAQQTVEQSSEQQKLTQQIVEAQAEYPELDGDSDQFSQEASDEALELFEGYKARGTSPAAAMERAVTKAAKLHGLSPLSKRGEPEPEKPAAKEEATPADIERKVEAAERQPADPGTRSQETDKVDITQLSEEEFDELPEKKKAELRGDA